jgi:hypothetical protein
MCRRPFCSPGRSLAPCTSGSGVRGRDRPSVRSVTSGGVRSHRCAPAGEGVVSRTGNTRCFGFITIVIGRLPALGGTVRNQPPRGAAPAGLQPPRAREVVHPHRRTRAFSPSPPPQGSCAGSLAAPRRHAPMPGWRVTIGPDRPVQSVVFGRVGRTSIGVAPQSMLPRGLAGNMPWFRLSRLRADPGSWSLS